MNYVIDYNRGWISVDDTGVNTSYYLYLGIWYRTLSPARTAYDYNTRINNVNEDGCVGHLEGKVIKDNGGVQIHELCYYIF